MISICIATVRPDTLPAAIQSVLRQTYTAWELIVVGQGDTDAMAVVVERMRAPGLAIRYVHTPKLGLSHARNLGIEKAQSDCVAFTDDDCEARDDWLETLASYLTRWRDVGLIGGSLIAPAMQRIGSCPQLHPAEAIYDPAGTPLEPPAGCDWVGANFVLRREIFDRIGPFDEVFGAGSPIPAAEDFDYKLRLEMRGVRMGSTPHAVVYHTHGFRSGFRAAAKLARNYAYGEGAVIAKMNLLDPSHRKLRHSQKLQETAQRLLSARHLPRLPNTLWRLAHWIKGHRDYSRNYVLDHATGISYPRTQMTSPVPRAHGVAGTVDG